MRISIYLGEKQSKHLRAYAELQDLTVYALAKMLILSYVQDKDALWDKVQGAEINAEYWRGVMGVDG